MGTYRLSQDAQSDLIRIHQRGVRVHGEQKADEYYYAFFDRFDEIADQPYLYQAVDDIRPGYRRSVCGVESIYYRVDGEDVEIMAILGQQDIEQWL